MIRVAGVVDSIDGSDVWVRLAGRQGGCGRCEEPGGCRSVGLAYSFKTPTDLFRVSNGVGANVGDVVALNVEGGTPLRGALLAYGLGAVSLILGAAGGTVLASSGNEDFFGLLGAVAGIGSSFMLNRWLIRRQPVLSPVGIELERASECAEVQRSTLG